MRSLKKPGLHAVAAPRWATRLGCLLCRKQTACWLLMGSVVFLLSACGGHYGAPVDSRGAKPQPQGSLVKADYYWVKRGDTLYSIAWQAGMDFKTLAALNGIRSPYTIYPGQKLRLSPQARGVAQASAVARRDAPPPVVAKHPPPTSPGEVQDRRPADTSKSDPAADNNSNEEKSRSLQWSWPTQGTVVQRYSSEDPTRKGLKIAGSLGQPIRATESGKVVYSGSGLIGYGRLVIIKHDKDYLTAYGHNRRVLVNEGDEVGRGEHIAEMGSAGGGKPVLHFEIRRQGAPVDPLTYLPRQP